MAHSIEKVFTKAPSTFTTFSLDEASSIIEMQLIVALHSSHKIKKQSYSIHIKFKI